MYIIMEGMLHVQYRRTGFDCECLLNANCEFFYDSQSFNKSNNSTLYAAASALANIRFAM